MPLASATISRLASAPLSWVQWLSGMSIHQVCGLNHSWSQNISVDSFSLSKAYTNLIFLLCLHLISPTIAF